MADTVNVRAGEISKEHTAYLLMEKIADAERKTRSTTDPQDRDYFLNLYVDCFRATKGSRPRE